MPGEESYAWKTSTASGSNECIAVAFVGDLVLVKHSKQDGPVLTFSRAEWEAFVAGVRGGEFQ
jgi:hypothetical protein